MVKKGIVLGALILSLIIIFGCAQQTKLSNKSEVFVSFFNETGGNVSENATSVVIITHNATEEKPKIEEKENVSEQAPGNETKEKLVQEAAPETGIPVKTFVEGDLVKLHIKATDLDNDKLKISYSPPLNQNGTWQTQEGDAGQYKIMINVSDGEAVTSKDVLLIIKPKNKPPVIEITPEVTVNEGETVSLTPNVYDPDNDTVTVTYTGWMTSQNYTTSFSDAGSYIVTIIASDGKSSVAKDVKVNVLNVNRPPKIAPLQPIRVTEGQLVNVSPIVTDLDNDSVTVSYTAPLNSMGVWQTEEGDAGAYRINVSASDGTAVTTRTLDITVLPLNRPPVIQRIPSIEVKEGETVKIEPVIIDPDGDSFTVSYSGWMTSNTRKTGYDDAGSYVVTVTATDSKGASSSVDVKITVDNLNRPPELTIE